MPTYTLPSGTVSIPFRVDYSFRVWEGNPENRRAFADILASILGVSLAGKNDLEQLSILRTALERRGSSLGDMISWANSCDPRITPLGWDARGCFLEKATAALKEPPGAAAVILGASLGGFALAYLLAARR